MRMVHALFPGIFLLQSPHPAEFGRGGAFDRIDSLEDRLQIESRVLADHADIDSLPVAEPVGNFRHRETLVLAAPVVELHLQDVAALYGSVLFRFGRSAFALAPLHFDLFLQAGDFLRPPEFVDPCHDVGVIREFGRKLVALEFAVEAALAEGLVHLRVVASPRSGDGMLDIETRGIAHEVGQADLFARIGANAVSYTHLE